MAEFKLGTSSIVELGSIISANLNDNGVVTQSELVIYLDKDEFKMVDEDLFYRNRKDNDEEFVPSEGEIIINFDLVKIIIKVKN